jgi:hypothetical protein
VQIFLGEDDYATYFEDMDEVFRHRLPHRFLAYSTNFAPPDEKGVRLPKNIRSGPVNHRVEISTIRSFFENYLGIDPYQEIQVLDWLTIPEQRLLTVVAGRVFHDDSGRLGEVRRKLAYYPRDIWLYLLVAQWRRISEEEAFMGRTGAVGDEIGSQIIGARMVEALMRLCFLMERQYAPYSKWLGTAFHRLPCAKSLSTVFQKVLQAKSWREREQHLSEVYSQVAQMHNSLGITKPLDAKVSPYFNRPYMVIHAERFAEAILKAIQDPEVKRIRMPIGSIDQFIDSTVIMTNTQLYMKLRTMYEQ